ncbi:hypothetical protein KY308_03780 [Candidatus Woesearchaeota archaeon]|nr:hypothetical protein [Candidatus Woesearchaeota archaeon]
MAKKEKDLSNVLALIEKRKLSIEKKRSLLNFEMAFFFPLFALLFFIMYVSTEETVKMVFFTLTIVIIIADLIYSIFIYLGMHKKQKELDDIIYKKLQ